jgi:hypothetical protein
MNVLHHYSVSVDGAVNAEDTQQALQRSGNEMRGKPAITRLDQAQFAST